MDAKYTKDQLAMLDEVINRLSKEGHIKGNEYPKEIFDILESEKWIISPRYENKDVIVVGKSPDFDRLLSGGIFSKRYKRKQCRRRIAIWTLILAAISAFAAMSGLIKDLICKP